MHEQRTAPGVRHTSWGRDAAVDRVRRITVVVAGAGALATAALVGLAVHETPPKHVAGGSSGNLGGPTASASTGSASTGLASGGAVHQTAPSATTQPAQTTTGQS
jgi:hypothetical protein